MELPIESKFQRWKWVEVGHYVPKFDSVIRIQKDKKPL